MEPVLHLLIYVSRYRSTVATYNTEPKLCMACVANCCFLSEYKKFAAYGNPILVELFSEFCEYG